MSAKRARRVTANGRRIGGGGAGHPNSLANLRPAPPPPPAGNVRALKHGAGAREATLIRAGSWAERILVELEREAPLRDESGDLPAHDRQVVELLASALARLEAVSAWLETRPPVDEKGRPWPAEELAGRLRREASRYLDALGMTPTSRARLGFDLTRTASVAQAMSEPDDERRRRLLREAGVDLEDFDGREAQ